MIVCCRPCCTAVFILPDIVRGAGGGGLPPDMVFHCLAGAPGSKTILDPAVKDLVHLVIGPHGQHAAAATAVAAAAVLCIHATIPVVPAVLTTSEQQ